MKKSNLIIIILFSIITLSACSNSDKTSKTQSEVQTKSNAKKPIPKNMIKIPSISLSSKNEADVKLKEAGIKVKYVKGNFMDKVSESTPFIPKDAVDYFLSRFCNYL